MALSKRKVHERVRASGLSQTVVSYRAGISNQYLNSLQYGTRDNPSADVLIRLARVLNCRVGDFFDDDNAGLGTEPAGAA
jgi:transcriptional regulator with XRE-family HTH domain